ncbi:MAG: DNA-directed RNA polymerase subunit L [Methanomicrobiales archaeon]|nr:DNA-directed RNA polymerase subunit L [Methanomicrobiales archaeon]
MELKVLELSKNRVKVLFRGEDNTFMTLLTEEILKDPDVDIAQSVMEFQYSDPELVVSTKGKRDPVAVIKDACARIGQACTEIKESLRVR